MMMHGRLRFNCRKGCPRRTMSSQITKQTNGTREKKRRKEEKRLHI
jgi:hypothetical protein